MNKYSLLIFCSLLVTLCSCKHLPGHCKDATDTLSLYPDYKEVCIPYNIAPLNFRINNEATSYLTSIRSKNGKTLIISGKDVEISLKDWKSLLAANKGEDLIVQVYAKQNVFWTKYPAFTDHIAPEMIDNYVTYRYIQPVYTTYEDMSINQRNLENFDVKVLYDNRLLSTEKEGQCVNCHSFQNYNKTGNMQFHVRGRMGGTVIIENNQIKKVDPKVEGMYANAVYPSWHPTMNLIAYSTNKTGQNFHTKDLQKIEVLDDKSDLVLYNVEKNEVSPIETTDGWLETYPYWSPDGKSLYYSCARYAPKLDNIEKDVILNYKNIKYNILRKSFDPATLTFGPSDTVVSAASIGKSATLPRVSPDGNYLLFSMGDFGNFHIWHKSSDLYLMDLHTGTYKNLAAVNSPDVESYHSWSSNGRWIIFTSRRDDGGYARLYIAYFDKNGEAHKPFVLPQKKPVFYKRSFKSFNIPEFTVKPVTASCHELVKAIRKEPVKATAKQ
ncbi:MAG: hypothetical protein Q8914_01245 [Bacteroidota bacterium]|nr:hypothetical protein [Bacteroidota bacterium]